MISTLGKYKVKSKHTMLKVITPQHANNSQSQNYNKKKWIALNLQRILFPQELYSSNLKRKKEKKKKVVNKCKWLLWRLSTLYPFLYPLFSRNMDHLTIFYVLSFSTHSLSLYHFLFYFSHLSHVLLFTKYFPCFILVRITMNTLSI